MTRLGSLQRTYGIPRYSVTPETPAAECPWIRPLVVLIMLLVVVPAATKPAEHSSRAVDVHEKATILNEQVFALPSILALGYGISHDYVTDGS